MKVPLQSLPIQRAIVSYSSYELESGMRSLFSTSNGVVASCENGVEQSGIFDIIKTIGNVANTVGGIAGALGGI